MPSPKIILLSIALLLLGACASDPESTIAFADLPAEGDPVRGEAVYNEIAQPACTACHMVGAAGAPSLENYAQIAGERVAGQSAREYTFYSIVEPWQHIVEGYGNAMPNTYDERLTGQDIADMIAYLLLEE